MCLIPFLEPRVYLSQLPLMSLPDKVRLRGNVQNTVTIPMMTSTGDQQLVLTISETVMGGSRVPSVVAQFVPDVTCPVDQSQPRSRDIEATVLLVVCYVRSVRWHTVVLAFRKSPSTPLLGVRYIDNAGQERRCVGIVRRCLVCSLFRASRVEVRS